MIASRPPSPVIRVVLAAAAILLAAVGCSPSNGDVPLQSLATPPRPTPAPPFTAIDSVSNAAVLAYAATLTFVDDVAVADTITIVEGSRRALMRFSPEVGSRTVLPESLQRGRVVARWMRFPDSVRYPMPTMMGYVWMDSVGSRWRVVYVSTDLERARMADSAFVLNDVRRSGGYPQPRAVAIADTIIGPFFCYWSDSRWICPRIVGLTPALVSQAYESQP